MFIFLHLISLTVRIETWIQFLSLLSLLHFSKVFISSKSSMNSSVSPAPKCKCNALYSTGYKSCFKRCVPFAVYMWNANTDWCWCSTCRLINTTPVVIWEFAQLRGCQSILHPASVSLKSSVISSCDTLQTSTFVPSEHFALKMQTYLWFLKFLKGILKASTFRYQVEPAPSLELPVIHWAPPPLFLLFTTVALCLVLFTLLFHPSTPNSFGRSSTAVVKCCSLPLKFKSPCGDWCWELVLYKYINIKTLIK